MVKSAGSPDHPLEGSEPVTKAGSPEVNTTGTLNVLEGNFQFPAASRTAPIKIAAKPGNHFLSMRRLYNLVSH